MISPVFVKLSLISLGTLGVGVGGYFVYKNTFSKKVYRSEATENRVDESPNHPQVNSPANSLESQRLPTETPQGAVNLGGGGNDVNPVDTR